MSLTLVRRSFFRKVAMNGRRRTTAGDNCSCDGRENVLHFSSLSCLSTTGGIMKYWSRMLLVCAAFSVQTLLGALPAHRRDGTAHVAAGGGAHQSGNKRAEAMDSS